MGLRHLLGGDASDVMAVHEEGHGEALHEEASEHGRVRGRADRHDVIAGSAPLRLALVAPEPSPGDSVDHGRSVVVLLRYFVAPTALVPLRSSI